MNKLTSLKILMLMSFTLGSSQTYSMSEAVRLQLQSVADGTATSAVLEDLAQLDPITIEHIIEDETDLQKTFNSIMKFIHKKNNEIKKISQSKIIKETDIARLTVELADAQALLEKVIAQQLIKGKKINGIEQSIKDGFMKAEQNIKLLSKKVESGLSDFGNAIEKNTQNLTRQFKKSKAGKAIIKASSDTAQAIANASSSTIQAVYDAVTL